MPVNVLGVESILPRFPNLGGEEEKKQNKANVQAI